MRSPTLRRNSFFVDSRTLRRAQRALKARTQAEVVRLALDRVVEMERFWTFMKRSRATLSPRSFSNV